MFKKIIFVSLLALCLMLSACSKANDLNLKLSADGGSRVDYIYYDDERVVYTVGGIMTLDLGEGSVMLEAALYDGTVTVAEILSAAETDSEDEDVSTTTYPDGSVEYHYETFDLIVLNVQGVRDIYFVPTDMSYFDVAN